MKRILFASLLSFSMIGVASAQNAPKPAAAKPPAAGKPAPAAAAGAPRVKNYDFDADNIDGELVKPEGEFVNARKFAEHGSLIRVRLDFIREIVKSAEDL